MKKNDRRFGLSKRQYRKLTQAIRHLLYQLRLWIRRRLAPLGRGGGNCSLGAGVCVADGGDCVGGADINGGSTDDPHAESHRRGGGNGRPPKF